MEVCKLKNIKKLIFSFSREVYGNSLLKLSENNVNIDNCENTYSASKISSEIFIKSYQKCYGINYINLRFSNVYFNVCRIVVSWTETYVSVFIDGNERKVRLGKGDEVAHISYNFRKNSE